MYLFRFKRGLNESGRGEIQSETLGEHIKLGAEELEGKVEDSGSVKNHLSWRTAPADKHFLERY